MNPALYLFAIIILLVLVVRLFQRSHSFGQRIPRDLDGIMGLIDSTIQRLPYEVSHTARRELESIASDYVVFGNVRRPVYEVPVVTAILRTIGFYVKVEPSDLDGDDRSYIIID